jgi:hypothetical protein
MLSSIWKKLPAIRTSQVLTFAHESRRSNSPRKGGVNSYINALIQRLAMLLPECNQPIEDGILTVNEAKRLLNETTQLQQVLTVMKLHLEDENG